MFENGRHQHRRAPGCKAKQDAVDIPMHWLHRQNVAPGLRNLGNTCFMNASLQCLAALPPLGHYCLRQQHSSHCSDPKSSCCACVLELTIRRMLSQSQDSSQSQASQAPFEMVDSLRLIGDQFERGRQEDAHEFLLRLLEAWERDELKSQGFQQDGFHLKKPKGITTQVDLLFGGLLQSTITCKNCKHQSKTFDPFQDLSLEIVDADCHSLQSALDKYTAPEYLTGDNKFRCEKCKQLVDACKQLRVYDEPNVLVVSLKRFSYFQFGQKVTKAVEFPEVLPFDRYLVGQSEKKSGGVGRSEKENGVGNGGHVYGNGAGYHGNGRMNGNGCGSNGYDRGISNGHDRGNRNGYDMARSNGHDRGYSTGCSNGYDRANGNGVGRQWGSANKQGGYSHGSSHRVEYHLCGVLVHIGFTPKSGHYLAYVRDGAGKWHKMDDAFVTDVTPQRVTADSTGAYILFYTRMASKAPRPRPHVPDGSEPTSPSAQAAAGKLGEKQSTKSLPVAENTVLHPSNGHRSSNGVSASERGSHSRDGGALGTMIGPQLPPGWGQKKRNLSVVVPGRESAAAVDNGDSHEDDEPLAKLAKREPPSFGVKSLNQIKQGRDVNGVKSVSESKQGRDKTPSRTGLLDPCEIDLRAHKKLNGSREREWDKAFSRQDRRQKGSREEDGRNGGGHGAEEGDITISTQNGSKEGVGVNGRLSGSKEGVSDDGRGTGLKEGVGVNSRQSDKGPTSNGNGVRSAGMERSRSASPRTRSASPNGRVSRDGKADVHRQGTSQSDKVRAHGSGDHLTSLSNGHRSKSPQPSPESGMTKDAPYPRPLSAKKALASSSPSTADGPLNGKNAVTTSAPATADGSSLGKKAATTSSPSTADEKHVLARLLAPYAASPMKSVLSASANGGSTLGLSGVTHSAAKPPKPPLTHIGGTTTRVMPRSVRLNAAGSTPHGKQAVHPNAQRPDAQPPHSQPSPAPHGKSLTCRPEDASDTRSRSDQDEQTAHTSAKASDSASGRKLLGSGDGVMVDASEGSKKGLERPTKLLELGSERPTKPRELGRGEDTGRAAVDVMSPAAAEDLDGGRRTGLKGSESKASEAEAICSVVSPAAEQAVERKGEGECGPSLDSPPRKRKRQETEEQYLAWGRLWAMDRLKKRLREYGWTDDVSCLLSLRKAQGADFQQVMGLDTRNEARDLLTPGIQAKLQAGISRDMAWVLKRAKQSPSSSSEQ